MDRGLRRNQVTETSIPSTVDVLLSPDAPLALRLSGQLLLGVCRIYSRKVDYLLQDCQDALVKIRLAFRPEQLAALTKAAAGGKGRRAAGGAAAADADAPVHTLPLECITLPDDLDELQLLAADSFDPRVLQPAMALEAMMAELQQATTSGGGGGGKRRRASMGVSLAAVPTDSGAHGGYSLGLLFAPSAHFSGAGGSGGGGAVDMEMEVFEDAGGPFQFDLEEVEIERLRAAPAAEAAGGGRQGAAELAALLGSGNLVPGGPASMVDEDDGTGSPSSGLTGVVSRERESAGLSVGRRRSTAAATTTAAAAGGAARGAPLGELLPDLGLDGGGDALDLEMDLGISEEQVDNGNGAGSTAAHSQGGSAGPHGSHQADPAQTPTAGGIRRRHAAAAGSVGGVEAATEADDVSGDGVDGAASAAAHRVSALRAASFTADEIRAAAAAMMERSGSADPYDIPPDAGGGGAAGAAVNIPEDPPAGDKPIQDVTTGGASEADDEAGIDDRHHVEAGGDVVMEDGPAGLAAATPASGKVESPRRSLGGPVASSHMASQVTGGAAAAAVPSGSAATGMRGSGEAGGGGDGGVDAMEVDGGVADDAAQENGGSPGTQADVRQRGSEGSRGQAHASPTGSVGLQQMDGSSSAAGGAAQVGAPAGSFGAVPSVEAPVELATPPPRRMATRRSTAEAAAQAAAAAAAVQAAAPPAMTEPAGMAVSAGQPVGETDAAAAQPAAPQPSKAGVKRVKLAAADGGAVAAAPGKRRAARRSITVDRGGVSIPAGHLREWLQDRSVLLDTTRLPGVAAGAARHRTKRRRVAAAILPELAAAEPAGMLHSWEPAALGSWPPACAVPAGSRQPATDIRHSRRPAAGTGASLAPELRALFQVSVGQLAPQYALQMGAAAAAHCGRLAGPAGLAQGAAAAGAAGSPAAGSPLQPISWRAYLHTAAAGGLAGAGTPAAQQGTPPQSATGGGAGRGAPATPGSARHAAPSDHGAAGGGGAASQGRAGVSTPGVSHSNGGASRGDQHIQGGREGSPRMTLGSGHRLEDGGEGLDQAQGELRPAASGDSRRVSVLSERQGTPERRVSYALAAEDGQHNEEFAMEDIEADGQEGVYAPDFGGAGPSGGFFGSGAAAAAPTVSEVSFGHADSEKENCYDAAENAPPGTGGKLPPSGRLSYGTAALCSPLVRRPLAPQQNACAVALLASAGKTASVQQARASVGTAAATAATTGAERREGDIAPGSYSQSQRPQEEGTADMDQDDPVSNAVDLQEGIQQALQPEDAADAHRGRRSVAGGKALGLEDVMDLDPSEDLGAGQGQGHPATGSQGTAPGSVPSSQRSAGGASASAGAHGLPPPSPAPSQQLGTGLRQRSEAARQMSQQLQQRTASAAAGTPVMGVHGGTTGQGEGLGLGSMLRPQQRLRWSNEPEDDAGRAASQGGPAGSHRSAGVAYAPDGADAGGQSSGTSDDGGRGGGALTPFPLLDQGAAGESGSGGMATGHGSFPRLRSTSGEASCYGSGLSLGRGDSLMPRTLQELDVVARTVAAAAVAAAGPGSAGAESQQELLGSLPVRTDASDTDADAGLTRGLGLLRHPFGCDSQQPLPSLRPHEDGGGACKVAGLHADAVDQHPTQLRFEDNNQGQGQGTQQRAQPATQEAVMPATQQHQPGAALSGTQVLPPWGEVLMFASSACGSAAGGSTSHGRQPGCAAGATLLSDLTRGRKRKDAARCFYDMLVLKSRGLVELQPTALRHGGPGTAVDAAGVATRDGGAGDPGQLAAVGPAVSADPEEVPDVWVTLTQVGVEAACVRLLPGLMSQ